MPLVTLAPRQERSSLKENYEDPVSGREGWWRVTLRETPLPGSYKVVTFVDDLDKRQNAFSFNAVGRRVDAQLYGRGEMLLPGAYEYEDNIAALEKKPTTYSFKSIQRDGTVARGDGGQAAGDGARAAVDGAQPKEYYLNWGKKDKDVNIAPNNYHSEDVTAINVPKVPVKHAVFKSQIKRFPTKYFKPKDGPSPGAYHATTNPLEKPRIVESIFKSKTPRFPSSHTKTPGPGTYTASLQTPMPQTITNMGKHYGIFFQSSFET